MTGNPLLDILISVTGIAMVVGLSFALGQNKTSKLLTTDQAAKRFRLDEPDFEAEEWVLDEQGLGALAFSKDGTELALIRSHGDRMATRRVPVSAISAAYSPPLVSLDINDSTWPVMPFTLPVDILEEGSLVALLMPERRPVS